MEFPVKKSSSFDSASAVGNVNQPASVGVGQVSSSVLDNGDKAVDLYQLPGDNTVITSEALPFIPSHLAAQAVPVSMFSGSFPLAMATTESQAGVKPSASALHRPRYQEVAPEYRPEPQFDDILDVEDDYADSSDNSFD